MFPSFIHTIFLPAIICCSHTDTFWRIFYNIFKFASLHNAVKQTAKVSYEAHPEWEWKQALQKVCMETVRGYEGGFSGMGIRWNNAVPTQFAMYIIIVTTKETFGGDMMEQTTHT